ncbi:MAG: hypothetical protein M1812_007329 [Candelaria pacifica]|nr:MAG: hypothetical protein M1812_007329 [Candelaria pacifica]
MTTISPQTAKQLRDYAQIYNWPLNILSRARDFTSLGIPFAWHYNDQGRPNTLIPAEKLRYPLSKERNKNNNHDYDEATHQAFHALLCDPDASKTKSATKGGYMQCSTCLDWMTDSGSKLSTIPPTIMLNIENKQTWTKKRTDMAEMPIPTNINTVDIMKISQTPFIYLYHSEIFQFFLFLIHSGSENRNAANTEDPKKHTRNPTHLANSEKISISNSPLTSSSNERTPDASFEIIKTTSINNNHDVDNKNKSTSRHNPLKIGHVIRNFEPLINEEKLTLSENWIMEDEVKGGGQEDGFEEVFLGDDEGLDAGVDGVGEEEWAFVDRRRLKIV